MLDNMFAKLHKRYAKNAITESHIDDIVIELIPRDKNFSYLEQGARNLCKAFIIALLSNREHAPTTLARFQDFCGLGYLEDDRLDLMRDYFKEHSHECKRLADCAITTSDDDALRILSVFYAHLANAKAE